MIATSCQPTRLFNTVGCNEPVALAPTSCTFDGLGAVPAKEQHLPVLMLRRSAI